MEPMTVAKLLAYSFGIFAFGSILRYWLMDALDAGSPDCRADEVTPGRHATMIGLSMTAVCTLWFTVLLLLTLSPALPWLPRVPLQVAQLVVIFLFPPLIMHIVYVDDDRYRTALTHPAWRVALIGMWLLSQSIAVASLLMVFGIVPRVDGVWDWIGYVIGGLFTLAAFYSAWATWKDGQRARSRADRSLIRWMLMLYGGTVLLTIALAFLGDPSSGVGDGLQFLVTLLPMAFFFTAMYHEDRFRFLDLMLKRGAFLLLGILALTAFFRWVLPAALSVEDPSWRAWTSTLLIVPLFFALRWIFERIRQWLDSRLFGRRLGSTEAIQRCLASLGQATDEDDLVARARAGLAELYQAPVAIHLGTGPAPRLDFEPELEQPVRPGPDRNPIGRLLLGARANRRRFFSEDVALIESLSEVFAALLENLRLQVRRQEQEQRNRELALRAGESELKALRAQINPHFLFNALNAIAGLIHKDPLRADRTVEQLAEIFRYTLRGSRREWTSLRDEVEFVTAYLEIERARFGNRLEVEVSLQSGLERLRIPALILQTLVENAIKHGVARVRGPARVEVRAERQEDRLVVEVSDSGPGFEEPGGGAGGEGFGLQNIRERLHGHFGDQAELIVSRDAEAGWTRVAIRIPVDHPQVRRSESGVA